MPVQADALKLSSRVPAIVTGALVPLGVGATAIVVFLATAAQSGAPFEQIGFAATATLMISGVISLGSLFAFPIAAALVSFMTWLMRRTCYADHLPSWTLAGPLFSLPVALILWSFDMPRAFPFGFMAGVSLGLIGGFTAGLKRPRPMQP